VVAAIGMAAGFGVYVLAAGTTALVLVGLITMRMLRGRILRRLVTAEEEDV